MNTYNMNQIISRHRAHLGPVQHPVLGEPGKAGLAWNQLGERERAERGRGQVRQLLLHLAQGGEEQVRSEEDDEVLAATNHVHQLPS